MLGGLFTASAILDRTQPLLLRSGRWLRPLVTRVVARFGERRPREHVLIRFLLNDRGFRRVLKAESSPIALSLQPAQHLPAKFAHPCQVPPWATLSDLAICLQESVEDLDWFSDRKGMQRVTPDGPLSHYRYYWVPKRRGRCRLIEAPKSRLREIQRLLLTSVLGKIPVHDAAHGFRKGRSIGTHTAPHVGRKMLLRLDLQDFFPTVPPSRLVCILMLAGYPEAVARLITRLCTNWTPAAVWNAWPFPDDHGQRRVSESLYQQHHFPQGSPASPAIANICAFRLDCRLNGLARASGAAYTRYADDLLFSGDEDFRRCVDQFRITVAAIVLEEGFCVNHHKTAVMADSVRQLAVGLVLNTKPNTPRDEYDRLKAILHQSRLHGPDSQNRGHHPNFSAHLLGRIYSIRQWNAARGEKLLQSFRRIAWPIDDQFTDE
jgi:RNA-directed DNA polymerase